MTGLTYLDDGFLDLSDCDLRKTGTPFPTRRVYSSTILKSIARPHYKKQVKSFLFSGIRVSVISLSLLPGILRAGQSSGFPPISKQGPAAHRYSMWPKKNNPRQRLQLLQHKKKYPGQLWIASLQKKVLATK